MKTLITFLILAVMTASVSAQEWPEEYLGLPGDNLNLYAVMKLFQESETLEEFERNLNAENSRINNLDLNGNNLVDYILVVDYQDGNVHNIVLRVALDREEYQDVAVFIVEQQPDGTVTIQLIGDEVLYGKNYIIEPYYALETEETPNPGYTGNVRRQPAVTRTVTVEIHTWPVVRYIYRPGYVVWRSAWHWDLHPVWWNPWRPYYWHYYYGYHYHWRPVYHRYYRTCNQFHYTRYNEFYVTNVRTYSPKVTHHISQGTYRKTYSRPDQKREGEALYARTQAERNAGRSNNAVISEQNRRSDSGTARYSTSGSNSSVSGRRTGDTGTIRNGSSVEGRNSGNISGSPTREASRRNRETEVSRSPQGNARVQGSSDVRRESSQPAVQRSSGQAVNRDRASSSPAYARPATRSSGGNNNQNVERSVPEARPATRSAEVRGGSNVQRSAPEARPAQRQAQVQRPETVNRANPPVSGRAIQGSSPQRGNVSSGNVSQRDSRSSSAPVAAPKVSQERNQAPQTKSASNGSPSVRSERSSSSRSSAPAVRSSESNSRSNSSGSSSGSSRSSRENSGSSSPENSRR